MQDQKLHRERQRLPDSPCADRNNTTQLAHAQTHTTQFALNAKWLWDFWVKLSCLLFLMREHMHSKYTPYPSRDCGSFSTELTPWKSGSSNPINVCLCESECFGTRICNCSSVPVAVTQPLKLLFECQWLYSCKTSTGLKLLSFIWIKTADLQANWSRP